MSSAAKSMDIRRRRDLLVRGRWQKDGEADCKGFEITVGNEPLKIREKQKAERRQQILECGLDMIVIRGFEATKIRDIADRLQISVGLFFNYFKSKEGLYVELVKIGLSGPASVLKLNTDEIEPIALFEKMTEAIFVAPTYSITAKMFLLMGQTIRSETAPESVKKLVADFDVVTSLLPVIHKGQERGQIKSGDPAALAIAYWGAVQGISGYFALCSDLPLPQSSWVVDILKA